jgi:hypothetical protein
MPHRTLRFLQLISINIDSVLIFAMQWATKIPPLRLNLIFSTSYPQPTTHVSIARIARGASRLYLSGGTNKRGDVMSDELDNVVATFANLQRTTNDLKDNKTKVTFDNAIDALLMAIGAIELRLNVLEMKDEAQSKPRRDVGSRCNTG